MSLTAFEAARPALLGLHSALLAAERRDRERVAGAIPVGAWYQIVLEDESLEWLREIGRVVARFDEAQAEAIRTETPIPPRALAEFIRQAHACVTPGPRYLELLQDHPDVVLAHRDAVRALPALEPDGR